MGFDDKKNEKVVCDEAEMNEDAVAGDKAVIGGGENQSGEAKNAVSGGENAVDARENAVSGDEMQEKVVQERYVETVLKVGFVPKTLWQIDEMEDITEEEREDLRKAYFVNKMKMTEQEKYLIRMLRANPELFAPTAELIKKMLEEDEVYKLYNENEQHHDDNDE